MAKVGIPCLALKVEIPCLALKVEIPCLALKFCYHFLDRAGQGRYSCYNRRTVHTEHFKFEMILSHPGYVQWQGDNWTFLTLYLYSERVTIETFSPWLCTVTGWPLKPFLPSVMYNEMVTIETFSPAVCIVKGWLLNLSHPLFTQWKGDNGTLITLCLYSERVTILCDVRDKYTYFYHPTYLLTICIQYHISLSLAQLANLIKNAEAWSCFSSSLFTLGI